MLVSKAILHCQEFSKVKKSYESVFQDCINLVNTQNIKTNNSSKNRILTLIKNQLFIPVTDGYSFFLLSNSK